MTSAAAATIVVSAFFTVVSYVLATAAVARAVTRPDG
jgi:hypothetical protein